MIKILGDNPFFGVNHAGKGVELYRRQNLSVASDVINEAFEQGFDVFMVSPHKELSTLYEYFHMGQIPLPLCVVWPYPHRLNQDLVELGYPKFLLKHTSVSSFSEILHNIFAITFSRTEKLKVSRIIQTMIENELLSNFSSQNVKYFALHNVIYDLLLASGNKHLLNEFVNAVNRLGFQPVLLTQNISRAITSNFYVEGCIICASLNPLGFMMDDDYDHTIEAVDNFRASGGIFWAMQILASGTLSLDQLAKDNFFARLDGAVYATTKKERIINFASIADMDL